MTPATPEPPHPARIRALLPAAILLLLSPVAFCAHAQKPPAKLADVTSANENPSTYKTFYLANVTRQDDLNDIQTDLRNMLPKARLYCVPTQNAISVLGSEQDIALAQKILADLDRPHKIYRLTYTITETGDGQPSSKQQVNLVIASGGEAQVKQGSRVPLVIGNYLQAGQPPRTDVQYQDVGLDIDATAGQYGDGLRLRSKIMQSGVSGEKSGIGTQDPVFRQTTLDATAILSSGKPLILGSLDVPGTNRHQQVEVVSETLP